MPLCIMYSFLYIYNIYNIGSMVLNLEFYSRRPQIKVPHLL